MPENERKKRLRADLAQKTTRELENILIADLAADKEPDAEMIQTVMEVMRDKTPPTEEELAKAEAARQRFWAAVDKQNQTQPFSAGKPEEHSHEHTCTTEQSQNSPRARRPLRYLLIAAIVVVLLAGTALGRNWFAVIAQWTAETFRFDTGRRTGEELPKTDAFVRLLLSVNAETKKPVVPCRAPEGTDMVGRVNITERPDNCRIQAGFSGPGGEFTIQYIIHDVEPDDLSGTYERDDTTKVIHEVGGIKHYITDNYDKLSAMWINGTVECYIQGDLTLEELQAMLNSIYEE